MLPGWVAGAGVVRALHGSHCLLQVSDHTLLVSSIDTGKVICHLSSPDGSTFTASALAPSCVAACTRAGVLLGYRVPSGAVVASHVLQGVHDAGDDQGVAAIAANEHASLIATTSARADTLAVWQLDLVDKVIAHAASVCVSNHDPASLHVASVWMDSGSVAVVATHQVSVYQFCTDTLTLSPGKHASSSLSLSSSFVAATSLPTLPMLAVLTSAARVLLLSVDAALVYSVDCSAFSLASPVTIAASKSCVFVGRADGAVDSVHIDDPRHSAGSITPAASTTIAYPSQILCNLRYPRHRDVTAASASASVAVTSAAAAAAGAGASALSSATALMMPGVVSMAVSVDSTGLLVTYADSLTVLLDLQAGTVRWYCLGHAGRPTCVLAGPGARLITGATDQCVMLWQGNQVIGVVDVPRLLHPDLTSGSTGVGLSITAITSIGSASLAVGLANGLVCLLTLSSEEGKPAAWPDTKPPDDVILRASADACPDHSPVTQLSYASPYLAVSFATSPSVLLRLPSALPAAADALPRNARLVLLLRSVAGRAVAVSGDSSQLHLLRLPDAVLASISLAETITRCVLHPSHLYLVVVTRGNAVFLVDLAGGFRVLGRVLLAQHLNPPPAATRRVLDVSVDPSGMYLAVLSCFGATEHTIDLLEFGTGRVAATFTGLPASCAITFAVSHHAVFLVCHSGCITRMPLPSDLASVCVYALQTMQTASPQGFWTSHLFTPSWPDLSSGIRVAS